MSNNSSNHFLIFHTTKQSNNLLKRKHMKKLLTLTSLASIGAVLALLAACQTTASQAVVQKEALLSQSGFKLKTATTPKQQQQVSQLPPNVVSAVKYQGNCNTSFPRRKRTRSTWANKPNIMPTNRL